MSALLRNPLLVDISILGIVFIFREQFAFAFKDIMQMIMINTEIIKQQFLEVIPEIE